MRAVASIACALFATASAALAQVGGSISKIEKPVTTINGQSVPGKLHPLVNSETMIDTIDVNGMRLFVTKGIRLAGTRVAIHVHEYGGHTCVLSGAITDFVEGQGPMHFPAGTCYYMPPNKPMTAVNLGTEDAVLIDTFILPPGAPAITILEPGYPGYLATPLDD